MSLRERLGLCPKHNRVTPCALCQPVRQPEWLRRGIAKDLSGASR